MRSTISKTSLFMKHLLSKEIISHADGRKLIELAEFAVSIRAFDSLAQIGAKLCEMPASSVYFDAGLLYTALALNRAHGCRVQAEELLQGISERASSPLKARALLALGSNYLGNKDHSQAIAFYQKARQIDNNSPLNIFYGAMLSLATEDEHGKALDALNGIAKLAQYVGSVYRPYWFNYLNSVATELVKADKPEDARDVLKPVLDSPFIFAYQEWSETKDEIDAQISEKTVVSLSQWQGRPSIQRQRQRVIDVAHSASARVISEMFDIAERI